MNEGSRIKALLMEDPILYFGHMRKEGATQVKSSTHSGCR